MKSVKLSESFPTLVPYFFVVSRLQDPPRDCYFCTYRSAAASFIVKPIMKLKQERYISLVGMLTSEIAWGESGLLHCDGDITKAVHPRTVPLLLSSYRRINDIATSISVLESQPKPLDYRESLVFARGVAEDLRMCDEKSVDDVRLIQIVSFVKDLFHIRYERPL